MMQAECIAPRVWRIPPEEEPLSSDVFVIEGDARYYVYDVGSSLAAREAIAGLEKPVTVILSHFHRDHTANLAHLQLHEVLVGARTRRQLGCGTVVKAPLQLRDGIVIEVQPCVSPHSPGCLIATVDEHVTLLGDLPYAQPGTGQGEAKGMLNALRQVKTEFFLVSHRQEAELVPREEFLARIRADFGI